MQINPIRHSHPPVSASPLDAVAPGDDKTAPGHASQTGRGAAVRQLTPAHDAPGVVAKIQSGSDGTPSVTLPPGLVYSNAIKTESPDADDDTARKAEQHRLALERTAASPTRLQLGKEGVLEAKTAQSGEAKSQDFVTFAVNTMREYADEQARLQADANQAAQSAAPRIPRSMADMQKLAARFKLFA